MNKEKIRVLIIKPMDRPKICYIEPSMKSILWEFAKNLLYKDEE